MEGKMVEISCLVASVLASMAILAVFVYAELDANKRATPKSSGVDWLRHVSLEPKEEVNKNEPS